MAASPCIETFLGRWLFICIGDVSRKRVNLTKQVVIKYATKDVGLIQHSQRCGAVGTPALVPKTLLYGLVPNELVHTKVSIALDMY